MAKLLKQIGDEVREYTSEEYQQHERDLAELEVLANQQKEIEMKKAIAEGKLAALGLTKDDLVALGIS